jgi:branched-chain amino acid aminotransferase
MKKLQKLWLDGDFVDWDDATIHILTHGLHYGYVIFEGMRCNSTLNGPAIFRLEEHLERLIDSAKIYRMKLEYSKEEIRDACVNIVKENHIDECYIRPIAFSAYGEMGLNPLKNRTSLGITVWEWGPYFGKAGTAKGVRCMVSSWVRIDSRSLPPQAKCSANYANSALAKMEAVSAGYDEALILNSTGMVAEGSGENVFKVKDGILSTPPASSGILRGVTRDSVIQFARDTGVTFFRNDFSREELFTADELFLSGTAAAITPIREVDGRTIGNGDYPLTRKLQRMYQDAINGKTKKYEKWLTYVN